ETFAFCAIVRSRFPTRRQPLTALTIRNSGPVEAFRAIILLPTGTHSTPRGVETFTSPPSGVTIDSPDFVTSTRYSPAKYGWTVTAGVAISTGGAPESAIW